MGRKAVYWGKETDEAILEYNKTRDEQLFNERIYPAIERLAYSVLHNYNVDYFESSKSEFMRELIGKLYEDLPRYDPSKGSGFSYFNVIARNYCWQRANETYMRMVQEREMDVNKPEPEPEPEFDLDKLWEMLRTLNTAVDKSASSNLKTIFPCIVYLFEHADEINPNFLRDKDYIYAWLRGKTGLSRSSLLNTLHSLKCLRKEVFPDEIC